MLYRLRDEGFRGYLVGGGVRDLLLGKTPKDYDISTDARPGQLRKIFKNSRVIGRRFRLVQVFFKGGKIIEVSTLRSKSEYDLDEEDEVLPSNNTYGTLAEDAFRRDLTINSLFYEIENFTVIDYTGGMDDIRNGIIRVVGDADRRIHRDPVRLIRAIRHASRTGFKIEPNTWDAIRKHMHMLDICPVSRIRDELFKDMRSAASAAWFLLAWRSGLFVYLFPCYRDLAQNKNSDAAREQLEKIFSIIDRLVAGQQRLPEHFILALILLPWAKAERGLMQSPIKGNEGFQYARKLRNVIGENFIHLNLKRAIKESMTGLLANVPLFEKHKATQNWPKWLKRKSYFDDSLVFYKLFQEIEGGKKVARLDLQGAAPAGKAVDHQLRKNRKKGKRKPAFAGKRTSVFGLKKR